MYSVRVGDKSQITVIACACGQCLHTLFTRLRGQGLEPLSLKKCLTQATRLLEQQRRLFGWFKEHFLLYALAIRPLLPLVDGHALSRWLQKMMLSYFASPQILPNRLIAVRLHLIVIAHWSRQCQEYSAKTGGKMVTKNTFSSVFSRAWHSSYDCRKY